jgi:hypothetical protein
MDIEIDFDVYKALTARRTSERVTENDVIRSLLGLPAAKPAAEVSPQSAPTGDWITKGVRFPAGTEFRATYKGKTHSAKVEGGSLIVDGKRFYSPSAAAVSITRNPVNGWRFWEARLPGQAGWKTIESLRKSGG